MQPKLIQKRYKVKKTLGRGAMGVVYLVLDTLSGRTLALKTLKTDALYPVAIENFKHEFKVLALMAHPNLAAVYEFAYDDEKDFYFYTSDYINGVDFRAAAEKAPIGAICELAVQVCRALQYIHSRGVIHYDVKPSNIIVTSGGPAKLLDFGVAVEKDVGLGLRLRGTVQYMAPEVIKGDVADLRADLYSLGATLYEVLTRKPPFASKTVIGTLREHLNAVPPPPRSLKSDIPKEIEEIILQLLSKEPSDRFPNANAVIRAFSGAVGRKFDVETGDTAEGYLLSGGFVGRKTELDALKSAIDRAVSGRSGESCYLVSGESGTGKSRLLREAGLYAQLNKAGYIRVECRESGGFPGPFAEALRAIAMKIGLNCPIVKKYSSALSTVLPEIKSPTGTSGAGVKENKYKTASDISDFILDAALAAPFVLAVENAEHAGEESISLIEQLARKIAIAGRGNNSFAGAVFSASYNPDLMKESSRVRFEMLCGNGYSRMLHLSPLSRSEQDELVSRMFGLGALPEEIGAALFEKTGGNPRLIEDIVGVLIKRGDVFFEAGAWRFTPGMLKTALPASASAMMEYKIGKLTPRERKVLFAMACFEEPAGTAGLAEITGFGADELGLILRGLKKDGLVSFDEAYNCSIARAGLPEALLSGAAEDAKREMHGKICALMENKRADADVLAAHRHLSGNREKALPLLRAAAAETEKSNAASKSIRLLEMLLEYPEKGSEEYFDVLIKIAGLHYAQVDIKKAEEYILRANGPEVWKYPELATKALSLLSLIYRKRGELDKAQALLKDVLSKIESETDLVRASAAVELAGVEEARGNMAEAERLLADALPVIAEKSGKKRMFLVQSKLAGVRLHLGKIKEVVAWCAETLKDKDAEFMYATVYSTLGTAYYMTGDMDNMLKAMKKSVRRAEKTGDVQKAMYSRVNFGNVYYFRGEYDKALKHYSEARRLMETAGDIVNAGGQLINLGNTELALGRPDEAAAYYSETLAIAGRTGSANLRFHSQNLLGEAFARAGKIGDSLRSFAESVEVARKAGMPSSLASSLADSACWTARLVGDMEEAGILIEEAEVAGGERKSPNLAAHLAYCRAAVKVLSGENGEALRLLDKAVELLERNKLKTDEKYFLEKVRALQAAGDAESAGKLIARLDVSIITAKTHEQCQMALLKLNQEIIARGFLPDPEKYIALAAKLAKQAGDKNLIWRVSAASAVVMLKSGNVAGAREYLHKAAAVADDMLATLPDKFDKKRVLESNAYKELRRTKEMVEESEERGKTPKSVDKQDPGRHESREKPARETGSSKGFLNIDASMLRKAEVDERFLTRDGIALLGMTSRLFSAGLEPQSVLKLILQMAIDVTGAKRGFVILVDGKGGFFHKAARNINDEEITSPEYETSHTMVQEVIRTRKAVLVADALLDANLARVQSVLDLQLRSVLCVPIISKEKVIGVVYLDNTSIEKGFTTADKALVEAFAGRISEPLELLLLHDEDQKKIKLLSEAVMRKYSYASIIGASNPMREIFELLDRVKDTNLNVYIFGETGTGKELIARALHFNSRRGREPFVSINCAAIPSMLLESELFGHAKGAFTGADTVKMGLMEAADKGTLFLDEIGSMPIEMQTKLLRALEQREVRPIGAMRSTPVDVRVVCSTNTRLAELVERGLFREDLFYRLNVVKIELPPLRSRVEDIPLLVKHFLKEYAKENETAEKEIEDAGLAKLCSHEYKGNVRELKNIVLRLIVTSGKRITSKEIEAILEARENRAESASNAAFDLTVDEYIRQFILANQDRLNETELATKLGISRNSLWRIRKKWKVFRST
jgi:transcriptional regulator with GAF, ATPase, and Fis domain/tetratricopeptide (TPR) repeat protein